MKTITFLSLAFFILLSFHFEVRAQPDGGCGCHSGIAIFNNGQVITSYDLFMTNLTSAVAYINPGDSVRFGASSIHWCGVSIIVLNNADTIFSGNDSHSLGFSVYDTGHYYFRSDCDLLYRNFSLELLPYMNTGIQQEPSSKVLRLYPTKSNGVFHLNVDEDVKQLTISDVAGRIVIVLTSDFSNVDITGYPAGIYMYTISDEKENIFRGRIVKE